MTKKTILIAIAITAGVLLLFAILWFLNFTGQFHLYRDKAYGFSIKFPKHWQVISHPQPGGAVVFVSPKETAMDAFQENVNIAVQDVPPGIATLKTFSDQILLQMSKVFTNLKVTESKAITFGGRSGYRVLFAAEKPDAIRILNVWTIKSGSTAYILTYMAAARQYKAYLPLVEEMIKSFRLEILPRN